MVRTDTLTVNGSKMAALVAEPEGTGPHPAIVVMCHISGLDEFTHDRCARLADAGFLAAAPDVFHYHPWIEDRNERRATLRDAKIVDDINATLDHLVNNANADASRLGILGHCMGGRTALLGAVSIPRFRALAIYYGGRTMSSWGDGPSPFDLIPNIKGPVFGFFGNLDQQPSPKDVDKIEAEMKRHKIPAIFHRYDGAGHAFQDHTSADRYRKDAAEDAWAKTIPFFAATIGNKT
ncbi:MAG: dienelactone hydrolase family protein [Hyphomicrobiaceae bacterium]